MLLLNSADTWEELQLLDGRWKWSMGAVLHNSTFLSSFSSLRVLKLRGTWNASLHNGVFDALPIFTQTSAPRLVDVTFDEAIPANYRWPTPIAFPLEQLCGITLHCTQGIKTTTIFAILSQCHQLEEPEMCLSLETSRPRPDNPRFTMSRLRKFHFTIIHGHHRFAYLLRHLTLPALLHISLHPPSNIVFSPLY